MFLSQLNNHHLIIPTTTTIPTTATLITITILLIATTLTIQYQLLIILQIHPLLMEYLIILMETIESILLATTLLDVLAGMMFS